MFPKIPTTFVPTRMLKLLVDFPTDAFSTNWCILPPVKEGLVVDGLKVNIFHAMDGFNVSILWEPTGGMRGGKRVIKDGHGGG